MTLKTGVLITENSALPYREYIIYLYIYIKRQSLFYIVIIFHNIPALIVQPEFRKCWDVFLNLNKMKTKRLSNHMSQYFIHNRT